MQKTGEQKSILSRYTDSVSFARPERDPQMSMQVQERASVRESVHSDAILTVYAVDPSNVLSGSQDRV